MAGNLTVKTALPSLGKLQTNALNKAQVMGQAASLVPDSNAFIKTIMDKDIHSAESNLYGNAINNLASDYIQKYSKNPFYAFTQEGKGQARKMQQIVNDPQFTKFESVKKLNDAEYDRVVSEGLGSNLVIGDGGSIAVMERSSNGNPVRRMIDPENFNPEIHRALDVTSDYQFLDRFEGSNRRAKYDTDTLENVYKTIRDAFSGLKSNISKREFDSIRNTFSGKQTGEYGVTQTVETETNRDQVASAIQSLENYGLSQKALKTLTSQYYRSNPQELGQEGARDRVEEWISEQIGNIANGRRIDTRRVSSKKGLGFEGSGGEGGISGTAPLTAMASWINKGWSSSSDLKFAKKHGISDEVSNLPGIYMFDPKVTNTDEYGRKVIMTTAENNKLLQFFNSEEIHIGVNIDDKDLGIEAGDIRRIGKDILHNAAFVFDSSASAKLSDMYVDNKGNILSAKKADEIENKYRLGRLTVDEQAQFISTYADSNGIQRTGVPLKKVAQMELMVGKKEGLFGQSPDNEEIVKKLEENGYAATERLVKEFNLRSGMDLDVPGGFNNTDEVFKINIFIPAGSDLMAAVGELATGGKPLIPKSDALVTNMMTRPFVRDINTDENSIRTGNAAQEAGYLQQLTK